MKLPLTYHKTVRCFYVQFGGGGHQIAAHSCLRNYACNLPPPIAPLQSLCSQNRLLCNRFLKEFSALQGFSAKRKILLRIICEANYSAENSCFARIFASHYVRGNVFLWKYININVREVKNHFLESFGFASLHLKKFYR